MPVRDPKLVRGILLNRKKIVFDEHLQRFLSNRPAFAPLEPGHESKNHEVVWLRQEDPLLREYQQIALHTDYLTQKSNLLSLEQRTALKHRPYGADSRVLHATNVDATSAVLLRGPLL